MSIPLVQPGTNIFKLGFLLRSDSQEQLIFLTMSFDICPQHLFRFKVSLDLKFKKTQGKRTTRLRVLCPVGVKALYTSISQSGHHRRQVDQFREDQLMTHQIFVSEFMMTDARINKVLNEETSRFVIEYAPDSACNPGQFTQRVFKKLTIADNKNAIAQEGHQSPVIPIGQQKTMLYLDTISGMK